MTSVIKPKRSATPGNVPTTTNLVEGEIAINLPDKKLYVRDTANNILTLAEPVVPAVEAAGDLTLTGGITLAGDLDYAANQLLSGTCAIRTGGGGTRQEINTGTGGLRVAPAGGNIDLRAPIVNGAGNIAINTATDITGAVDIQGTLDITGNTSVTGTLDMLENNIDNVDNLVLAQTANTRDITLSNDSSGHPSLLLSGYNANQNNRRTSLIFQQTSDTLTNYQGLISWQNVNGDGDDIFKISHANDDASVLTDIVTWTKNGILRLKDGSGNDVFYSSSFKADGSNVVVNKQLQLNTTAADGNTIQAIIDMSGTTTDLQNANTYILDYGTDTVTTTKQNAFSFNLDDSTGSYNVAKLNAEFNPSSNENKFKMIAINKTGQSNNISVGGNGQLDVSPQRTFSNVPYELPQYTTTEMNNLSAGSGYMVYNSTINMPVFFNGSSWLRMDGSSI